jgi:hypothetical protein
MAKSPVDGSILVKLEFWTPTVGPFRLTQIPPGTLVAEQPEGKIIGTFNPDPVTLNVMLKIMPFVGAEVA